MTSTLAQVMVDFTGDGSGEGELSWGQQENWHRMMEQRMWAPLGGVGVLPPGTTVDDAADALRYLMSRHQSLRTRVRLVDGRPIQVVHGAGRIPLHVVDAPDDADPGEFAESVAEGYRATPMDFTAEWPLRMAVLRHRGTPTHAITLVSHLATDVTGIVMMMSELAARTTTPVDGTPPLAQAAWQRSPAGRRHNAAAMRYWEGLFRTIGPRRFPADPTELRPRYWDGEFRSPSLLSAVRTITESTGHGANTVFLTLFALSMHQVTGINPVVVRPVAGNRFRPGLAGVVCTVAQAGICVLDVAGRSFADAAAQVRRAVINAYKYSYFDHEAMVALRTRIEAERGVTLETRCFLNDRYGIGLSDSGSAAADGVSEFRWIASHDAVPNEPLFVEIDDVPGAIRVTLHLDTRSLGLTDAEAFARGIETAAIAAVTG